MQRQKHPERVFKLEIKQKFCSHAPEDVVFSRNKKIIFTFIFEGYDVLKEPAVVTPGWDYFCMSDTGIYSNIWQPINLAKKLSHINCPKRKASLLKIEHYKYIPYDYDVCITLDGSMLLNTDLNLFLDEYWEDDTDLMIARHPKRKCIYDESVRVLELELDTKMNVLSHMRRYSQEGFPRNQGLYGTRMMVKNNKSEKLRRVCEIWGREYSEGSRRDQLSLNYAIWKAKQEGIELKIKEFDFNDIYHKSRKFIITQHRKRLRWR